MTPNRNSFRRGLVWAAAGAATLGIGLGAAGLASAATSTTDSSTTVVASDSTGTDGVATTTVGDTLTPPADRPQLDPASLPNGPGETVLTGDVAAKVTAAAEAAEPGATVIRVETDSSGHAYEAHVQLADGSYSTLYFDESFAADGSDDGFGPAPQGAMHGHDGDRQGQPPAGQAPGQSDASSTTVAG